MTQRRYRTIRIEFMCDCGECEGADTFSVVEEEMTDREFVENPADERILCDCYTAESADRIVSALNRLATN